MTQLEVTQFLGWTPEQWTAVRLWARRHGVTVPAKMFPAFEQWEGRLMPTESIAPYQQLQHAWKSALGYREPSLGDEMLGFVR